MCDCVSGMVNSLLPVQVHTKVSECVSGIVNSLLPVQVHTKVLRDKKEDQTKTFLDSLVAATVSEKAALENMRSDKDLDGIFSRIGGVCWDTHTHTHTHPFSVVSILSVAVSLSLPPSFIHSASFLPVLSKPEVMCARSRGSDYNVQSDSWELKHIGILQKEETPPPPKKKKKERKGGGEGSDPVI